MLARGGDVEVSGHVQWQRVRHLNVDGPVHGLDGLAEDRGRDELEGRIKNRMGPEA